MQDINLKLKKKIANANYYNKNKIILQKLNKQNGKQHYESDEEYRLKKIAAVKHKYYVNSAVQYIRKLYF